MNGSRLFGIINTTDKPDYCRDCGNGGRIVLDGWMDPDGGFHAGPYQRGKGWCEVSAPCPMCALGLAIQNESWPDGYWDNADHARQYTWNGGYGFDHLVCPWCKDRIDRSMTRDRHRQECPSWPAEGEDAGAVARRRLERMTGGASIQQLLAGPEERREERYAREAAMRKRGGDAA